MDKETKLIFENYRNIYNRKIINEMVVAIPYIVSLFGGAAAAGGFLYYLQQFLNDTMSKATGGAAASTSVQTSLQNLSNTLQESENVVALIDNAEKNKNDLNLAAKASSAAANFLLSKKGYSDVTKIGLIRSNIDQIIQNIIKNQNVSDSEIDQLLQLLNQETAAFEAMRSNLAATINGVLTAEEISYALSTFDHALQNYKSENVVLFDWIKSSGIYVPKGTSERSRERSVAVTGGPTPEPPDDDEKEFIKSQRQKAGEAADETIKREKLLTAAARLELLKQILGFIRPARWIVGGVAAYIAIQVFLYFKERGPKGVVTDFFTWMTRGGRRGMTTDEDGNNAGGGRSNNSSNSGRYNL